MNQTFKAGDPVPAWLLDFEPCAQDSERPRSLTFNCAVHVVAIADRWWVLPDAPSDDPILCIEGGYGVTLLAPGDPVCIPSGYSEMHDNT